MSQERVLREILMEIERNPSISQKRLSESVGVSVGMVNWHIKRCVGKGFIKLQQAPVRRYLYYLTPEGFIEKASLTANYLRSSFDIFKAGRKQYEALFNLCAVNGWNNIILLGQSELSELAELVSGKAEGVTSICILDMNSEVNTHNGIQIVNTVAAALELMPAGCVDAVIGTHFDLRLPDVYDLGALAKEMNIDKARILIPAFLQ